MKKQGGTMLVVTLIILLIVSMLGMSTMDSTGLEMRMASYTRDQQVAFEAAEYTLSWVQDELFGGVFSSAQLGDSHCGNTCFDLSCSGGFCFNGEAADEHNHCQLNAPGEEYHESSALWKDGSGRHQTFAVPETAITVKYFIEFRCYTAIELTEDAGSDNYARLFRITAFAVGPGERGRVMLRSTVRVMDTTGSAAAPDNGGRVSWEVLAMPF